MNHFFKFIFLIHFALFASVFFSYAQEGASKQPVAQKKNSQAAKEKRRKEKELIKYEKEAKKHHLSIQSKDTRKRMKRNMKSTTASKNNKKEIFIKRWFSRKY